MKVVWLGALACLLSCSAPVHAAKKENSWPVRRQSHEDGPGNIVGREVHPWMVKTLNELEQLSGNLLERVSVGIRQLEPHVDRSPMYDLDREEFFANMTRNIDGYLTGVYEDVLSSWRNLTVVNDRYEDRLARLESPYACVFALGSLGGFHPYQNIFSDLDHMAAKVQEAHEKGASLLLGVMEELSVTTKAIAMNCVTIIMETLRLKKLEDEDARRLLENNLQRMAPNFLGKILKKITEAGSDPSSVRRINKNVLGETAPAHHQMREQLSSLSQRCYPCQSMHGLHRALWRTQHHGSRARVQSRPSFHADLANLYQQDEFLTDVTLSLMASFSRPPGGA